MSSIVCKIFKVVLLASVLVILTGCNSNSHLAGTADAKEVIRSSAWLAYWELDAGEKDLQRIAKKLDKLSYFGAYFDPHGRIFIPQELSDKQRKLKAEKRKYETYLTFVNDKQNFDGSLVMKDTEVLRAIFSNTATMERHIDEIITLTLEGKYDGIEIDYERIWKDEKIGQFFLKFVDKLYVKAQENNLKLRIILEPSMPFSSANFFKGPEYVVMLYNLYGLHSDPGPKANKEFIKKTVIRMKDLPGEKSVAFSTGGCLWGDDGTKRFLTETEAKTLVMTYGSKTKRDKESQCIVFDYKDMGVSYQVWYADVETLNYWISIAKEEGVNNISLWRLGGNIDIRKIK
ncbi:hypothetical protein [Sporomusa malonica]|uniref:Glycosyl hydrolases family 18 n=1 Tax=Sporomusa malonica TaxID=112901 RepID=A0A1W2CN74_9FIRM|nr:hypothetical protein [Sporomusa malonica]SMC86695.1 hypothetical protein SAMN04488500_11136 [Sporomusa malonica]